MVRAVRYLRRIFGPKRDEVIGEWRKLHNVELNDLYCSPNIVRVIKSRRMRWAGHVARVGEEMVCELTGAYCMMQTSFSHSGLPAHRNFLIATVSELSTLSFNRAS